MVGSTEFINYAATVDTSDFEKGATLMRKEQAAVGKALRLIETPAEKAEKEIELLTQAFKKGAITQDQYNRRLNQIHGGLRKTASSASKAGQSFAQGMGNATPAISGMTSSLANIHPVAAVAAIGLGGVTIAARTLSRAARETIANVREQIDALDKSGKAADKLGLTQRAFAALSLEAEHAAISQEQLETIFQKQQKTIGDAQRGFGASQKAIESLGLSYQALSRQSPENQFITITGAISKLETQTEKMSAAQEIFGRSGGSVLRFLTMGKGGFDAAVKAADKYRLAMTQVEKTNVAAAVDSVGDLRLAWDGVFKTVAKDLAPTIAAAARTMTEFVTSAEGTEVIETSLAAAEMAGWAFLGVLDGANVAIATIRLGAVALEAAFIETRNSINEIQKATASAFGDGEGVERERMEIAANNQRLQELGQSYRELNQVKFGDITEAFTRHREEVKRASQEAAREAETTFHFDTKIDFAAAFAEFEGKATETAVNVKAAIDEIGNESIFDQYEKEFADFEKQAAQVFESTRTPMEKYQARVDELNNLKAFNLLDDDTFNRAMAAAKDQLDDFNKDADKTRKDAQQPITMRMASEFGSAETAAKLEEYRNRRIAAEKAIADAKQQQQASTPMTMAAPQMDTRPPAAKPIPMEINRGKDLTVDEVTKRLDKILTAIEGKQEVVVQEIN